MKLHKTKSFKLHPLKSIRSDDLWQSLSSIFEVVNPQACETDVIFQVQGVYSLPEFWLKLQASGSVDQWYYTAKAFNCELVDGKLNQRELTEDEKKELENKKKPPPKINKKDLEAVRAEEERIEREQKEKEERERKFQEELAQKEPQEQFYFLKEMPTKEPWISWKEKNNVSANKQGETLLLFEEDVNIYKGAILQLNFIPSPEENEKKRPKPKGINPEEVKPVYTVGWITLESFKNTPGLLEISLRCNLQLKETYEKRIEWLKEKTGVVDFNPNNPTILEMIKENEEENLDYVEKAKTYIKIRVVLSKPIKPVLPDVKLPDHFDLIKKVGKKIKTTTIEEIEGDLLKQFKIAIAAIAKAYDEAIGNSGKGILVKREKGNLLSKGKKDNLENTINAFLDKFNQSGRANLLKEKLKKFIVKIVREKYDKKKSSVKGVFKDNRDQFYSELYAYLTGKVAIATEEFVNLKMDEIHENVLVTFAQSKKEIMNYIVRANKEPEDKRLLRLSSESELLGNYDRALKYYRARLALDSNKEAWLNYGKLAKKLNDYAEVERALSNAIVSDKENEDMDLELVYCGNLYLKNQSQNAINFLNLLLLEKGINGTTSNFTALLSFLYKEKVPATQNVSNVQNATGTVSNNNPPQNINDLLAKKFLEASKLYKLRTLPKEELQPAPIEEENPEEKKENKKEEKKEANPEPEEKDDYGNYNIHANYRPPVLNNKQVDSIWFDLIRLFNKYNFYEISEKLLNFLNEESKEEISFKVSQAETYLFRKDFEKVIQICDEIIKIEPQSYDAFLFKANAYYYLQKYTEAEECYIRSFRYKPQEIPFNVESLTKLGLIYIKTQQWYDAKVIFKQVLQDNINHSFAWLYLGISLNKLGEYEEAEKALAQANILDIENPIIWAHLTIYCLSTKKINQAIECFNELGKKEFTDESLMKEIALLFYQNSKYELAANIYNKITKINPTDAENYIRIAEIYYEHTELKKNEAIEVLKKSRENVIDEEGKREIENAINEYEKRQDMLITGGNIYDENADDDLNLSGSIKEGTGNLLGGEINPDDMNTLDVGGAHELSNIKDDGDKFDESKVSNIQAKADEL